VGVKAHGERAEHESITGVWGQSPQRGPGAEPLVRGSGSEAPRSWSLFLFQDVTYSNQGKRFRFLFLLSLKVVIWQLWLYVNSST